MKGTRRAGAHNVQPVCGHSAYARCGLVVRGEKFFLPKERSARVAMPPPPPLSSEGLSNIHQVCLETKHGSAWVGRH